MGQVTGSPGEFTIGSLNDATPWLELSGLSDDPTFNIAGTFVGTVSIQVSNQSDATKTRYSTLSTTYSSTQPPTGLPRIAGRWFRFVMTAYTSGTAYIGLSRPNRAGADATPMTISAQVQTNLPVTDEF